MSIRIKFVLLGGLLFLALIVTAFAAVTTIQAFERFREQHALVQAGAVQTLSPWMTIPYIARTYHVPEKYLYQSLHITDPQPPYPATLQALADRFHQPVETLIHILQRAILQYRQQHPGPHSHPPSVPSTPSTTAFWPRGRVEG